MKKIYFLTTNTLLLLFTSCANVSGLRPDLRVTYSDVVRKIQCEIYAAHLDTEGAYDGWSYSVASILSIKNKDEGRGEFTFVNNVPTGTLTVKFGGGGSEEVASKLTHKFKGTVDKIPPPSQLQNCNFSRPHPHRTIIGGSFGINKWMLEDARVRKLAVKIDPTGFSNTLDFDLIFDGSVTPSFSVVPGGLMSASGSGTIGGKHTADHNIIVAFAPPPKKKPPPVILAHTPDLPQGKDSEAINRYLRRTVDDATIARDLGSTDVSGSGTNDAALERLTKDALEERRREELNDAIQNVILP